MSTPVTQWQVVCADPAAAASFYAKVFGWSIDAANAMGYRQIAAQPGGIAGGIWPAPPGAPALVQVYVTVPDVAAYAERAQAAGATVLVPVSYLPDGDVMAVLRDPQGISFGLVQSR